MKDPTNQLSFIEYLYIYISNSNFHLFASEGTYNII